MSDRICSIFECDGYVESFGTHQSVFQIGLLLFDPAFNTWAIDHIRVEHFVMDQRPRSIANNHLGLRVYRVTGLYTWATDLTLSSLLEDSIPLLVLHKSCGRFDVQSMSLIGVKALENRVSFLSFRASKYIKSIVYPSKEQLTAIVVVFVQGPCAYIEIVV